MNKEEIEERIEKLEELIFQVDMVDRWGARENELWKKYNDELRELKEKLIDIKTKTEK